MERVRKDDYLFCYWKAEGGHFAWAVERGGELFFFIVLTMRTLTYQHWAYNDDRNQVDVIRKIMACLGFQEVPVYAPFQNAKDTPEMKELLEDIKIFDETLAQLRKAEAEKLKQSEKDAKGKAKDVAMTSGLSLVDDKEKDGESKTKQ